MLYLFLDILINDHKLCCRDIFAKQKKFCKRNVNISGIEVRCVNISATGVIV